ncbi:MAG: hypothetical protein JW778_03355 [Candidatus Altiarchaeota archaeon]|nr:hypothetical protein [Candidatus Altiarchaeota archaeon]
MRRQLSYPKRKGCEIVRAMQKKRPMSKQLCLICKGGRALCGITPCPLLKKIHIQNPVREKLVEDFFGPSPSIFVGRQGYPDVFIGPMTSLEPEKACLLDNPQKWYGSSIDEIIDMRSLLVRSKKRQGIRERTKYVENSKELALSVKPTDVEVLFKEKPTYRVSFSPITQPMGPSGVVERFRITENPTIPRRVDSVVSDEIRAGEAVLQLYNKNLDVYYLTNVLSSGALGLQEDRRLVPTRWSITAIDDIIAKGLIADIRDFPELNGFLVYENTYLENHFEVLMMPGGWEFEQFEAWAPKTLWTMAYDQPVIQEEYEGFKGRTRYADKEGGGYYAGRIAVVEKLHGMKKQARVVVFREIYGGYTIPVGVWEVRENVRHALEKKPSRFTTLKEALDDISSRLRIPIKEYTERSEILRQRKLSDYF